MAMVRRKVQQRMDRKGLLPDPFCMCLVYAYAFAKSQATCHSCCCSGACTDKSHQAFLSCHSELHVTAFSMDHSLSNVLGCLMVLT